MSEEKLSARLEMHANAHASVSPYDDEQAQWEADLRKAVEIVRRVEEAPMRMVRPADAVGEHLGGRISAPRSLVGQRILLVREL